MSGEMLRGKEGRGKEGVDRGEKGRVDREIR
jgi:hypothetical protein